jgi:hypothetical protein
MAKVNQPHARQDYCSPPELLEAVQVRFGQITFDAACTTENAVAAFGYAYPAVDALAADWSELADQRVWITPPFGLSRAFARKAAESQQGLMRPLVMLLVPASVDSNWYREHTHGKALVLPLSPRITFVGQPAPINRPLMLCVYGPYITPGFEPWQWQQPKNKKDKNNGNSNR